MKMGGGSYSYSIGVAAAIMVAFFAVKTTASSSSSESAAYEPPSEYCNDVLDDVFYCSDYFSGSEAKPDGECCVWFNAYSNVSADYLTSVCQCLKESGSTYHPNLSINIPQECGFYFPVTFPAINDENCSGLGSSY